MEVFQVVGLAVAEEEVGDILLSMQTVTCTHCGKDIEISEAITHQIEESVLAAEREKHEQELKTVEKKTEEKLLAKLQNDFEMQIKGLQKEKDEERERNKNLLKQLEELSDQIRSLKRKDEERDLEMKKKLAVEEQKLRSELLRKHEEEQKLLLKDKDQTIEKLMKDLEEAKRRAEQGSQQAQGESLELVLEELLPKVFPMDDISEVKKGALGADVRQVVKSPSGKTECGVILWESKRAKNWSDGWVKKLKEDVRRDGANIGVIVTTVMPKDAEGEMILIDKIWVVSFAHVIPLALLIRDTLIKVSFQKKSSEHRGQKADLIYEYVTSHQFRQQIESIVESYKEMNEQIQKERVAFERIWKKREAQLTRIITGAATVYGSLQGLAGGTALPTLKGLDVLELEEGE